MALQLRRGLKSQLPATALVGEPLIATDTRELYVGTGTSVYKVGDVIFSDVAPDVVEGKLWVNITTNSIYRANGAVWAICTTDISGLIPKTDISTAVDLGAGTASDTLVPSQKAVKTYVDTVAGALTIPKEWPDSVISGLADPPVAPTAGDRYMIIATATGAWAGKENQLAEYKAGAWVYTTPTTGTFLSVDADATGLYYFGGGGWIKKSFELTTVGKGLKINAGKIDFADDFAGTGLAFDTATGILSVGVIDGGTFI